MGLVLDPLGCRGDISSWTPLCALCPSADGDEGTGCESLSARDRAVSTPKPPGITLSLPLTSSACPPTTLLSSPPPTEPEDGLMEQAAELRAVVSDLSVLSSRIQELEQSEFRALQAEM